MLIILILLALTIVLIGFSSLIYDRFEGLSCVSLLFGIIFFVFFVSTSFFAVSAYVTRDADVAALQVERQSLVYQLENIDTLYGDSCANDRKELFNQIQEWNSDVASGRKMHSSFWTNWLAPIDWEQIDYIEVK